MAEIDWDAVANKLYDELCDNCGETNRDCVCCDECGRVPGDCECDLCDYCDYCGEEPCVCNDCCDECQRLLENCECDTV